MRITLLLFLFTLPCLTDGHGVIPHYIVIPSIYDHLQLRDVELDFARKLADKKEN